VQVVVPLLRRAGRPARRRPRASGTPLPDFAGVDRRTAAARSGLCPCRLDVCAPFWTMAGRAQNASPLPASWAWRQRRRLPGRRGSATSSVGGALTAGGCARRPSRPSARIAGLSVPELRMPGRLAVA